MTGNVNKLKPLFLVNQEICSGCDIRSRLLFFQLVFFFIKLGFMSCDLQNYHETLFTLNMVKFN